MPTTLELGVVTTLFLAIIGCYAYVHKETKAVCDDAEKHNAAVATSLKDQNLAVTQSLKDLAAQIETLSKTSRERQERDAELLNSFRLEVAQRLARIETALEMPSSVRGV